MHFRGFAVLRQLQFCDNAVQQFNQSQKALCVLAYFRGDTELVREPQSTRPALPPAALTNRETEVLRRLAQGLTLGEVGKELTLSVNTVKTHVKNVYARLDVSSRIAAVDAARRMGILDDDARR